MFSRLNKRYRVGLMPRNSLQHARKVRSDTPTAAQSSGMFSRGPICADNTSSNRTMISAWCRLVSRSPFASSASRQLTSACSNSCSSARATSGCLISSCLVSASRQTLECEGAKSAPRRPRTVAAPDHQAVKLSPFRSGPCRRQRTVRAAMICDPIWTRRDRIRLLDPHSGSKNGFA